MAEENLVPVFIPPLAVSLAHTEKAKGGPLTETEVVRVRDKAVCMMMETGRAEQMTLKRGYRDVNPETCWSDWHRLRVQMTGNGYLPKFVLCFVGPADLAEKCSSLLEEEQVEHEFRGRDKRMVKAFKTSISPNAPAFSENDYAGIRKHESVLYVLSDNFTSQEAPAVSRRFLRLGGRVLRSGAVAMKCESSGIAHATSHWLKLAEEADSEEYLPALFHAFVQMPIQDEDDFYSCGMHLLGKPDLIVSDQVLRQALNQDEPQVLASINLFQSFALYLLMECAEDNFGSGHTFSLDASGPRFRVLWQECTGYDEDEFFFNSFGRWRFVNA